MVKMNLIYYYPVGTKAPESVARAVFKYLQKRRKELPFENLKLFTKTKDAEVARKQFSNLEVITYKNLNKVSKDSVIHIPLSPHIMPNSKFLLHLFAVLKRRKLILQYHGDTRTEMYLRFKYQHSLNIPYIPSYIALQYLLKSADKLIVNSYLMSNLVRARYGVKNDVIIPNGIDDFWFDGSDKKNIELDGAPNIFYHGRLSPEKGVDLLIKGFAKAISKNSKMKLYIAGEGSQREQLEKLCVELGIKKRVIFLGYIDQHLLKSYISSVDAALYPSIYEPFSLAILEVFSSANCPVYFSKQAGIDDFVIRDGYRLNAFEPTVENISEIIKDIIRGTYEIQVVKQQKEFARRYTWDKVFDDYIKLYNSVF
jgi:glycosyltransferase involved in cell wall biosynthesis